MTNVHLLELRRLLLNEAVGREVHADWLAELTHTFPALFFGPAMRAVAHAQRVRAMELRGQAAALTLVRGRGD